MGALEVVREEATPGYYSHLFQVPKESGEMRTIINLRSLNHYVIKTKFKMETLDNCLTQLKKGMFAAKVDLKDAYFQILIHPSSRKYLRIAIQSDARKQMVLQFRALPFGLSSSPYVFTKVVSKIGQYLRERGIEIFQYLDDWLLFNTCRQDLCSQVEQTARLLKTLGVVINTRKSVMVPSQQVEFLGALIDLQQVCYGIGTYTE